MGGGREGGEDGRGEKSGLWERGGRGGGNGKKVGRRERRRMRGVEGDRGGCD